MDIVGGVFERYRQMTFKNYKKKKQKQEKELLRTASWEVIKRISKVYQRGDENDERESNRNS